MEQVSSLSTPNLPSLPPPVQKVWSQVGEGQQNLTKTKAACSNRLLPKGYRGNRGTQTSSLSGIWRGTVGTMPSEGSDRDRRVRWGGVDQVVDIISGWRARGSWFT